jgi:putative membrane protein
MNSTPNRDDNAPPLDTSTRLAYENLFLAQERTQMAWIQVSLAFISFGFTIAKFFEYMHERRGEQATVLGTRTVGILMIAMGLAFLTLASVQHRRAVKAMREKCSSLPTSQAGILAILLVVLGFLALIVAFLRQ